VKNRRLAWTGGALAMGLIAGSVSWTSRTVLVITDEYGVPATDAYVRYYHTGDLINFVHPVTYVARGSAIERSDSAGRVSISGRVHFRSPLPPSTVPALVIDRVYVPRLHNAFGRIGPMTQSRPGVFRLDDRHEHVFVSDVSGSPERWERSLMDLFDAIRNMLSTEESFAPADPRDRETAAHILELIGHARREYAAFLGRYGATARARPDPPAGLSSAELEAWEKQIDAQLVREPFWGVYLERTWSRNLKQLDEAESSLKGVP
jgi:hypothetical protein